MAHLTEKNIVLKNNIKLRINELLELKGLRQTDLASLSLKDRQAINRWTNVNNDRGITIYTIEDFCDIIKISLFEFFDSPHFNKTVRL